MINMKRNIAVVVADDHAYVREGLKEMLQGCEGIDVMAVVSDGVKLLKAVEEKRPDIVITDIRMPEMDGIEAAEIILQQYPCTGLIAISADDQEFLLLRLLEAGFKGILLKTAEKSETFCAIQNVFKGEDYYCRVAHEKIHKLVAAGLYHPGKRLIKKIFSEREDQILRMICDGMTSKKIGEILLLSIRTVESHREKLFLKTKTSNVAGLVKWAVDNRMV